MVTHSQGEMRLFGQVVALKLKQKCLDPFHASYNQHKQKIKHNKIQLKQELSVSSICKQWKATSQKGGN